MHARGLKICKVTWLEAALGERLNECNARPCNFADLQTPHPETGSHALNLEGQHRLESVPSDAGLADRTCLSAAFCNPRGSVDRSHAHNCWVVCSCYQFPSKSQGLGMCSSVPTQKATKQMTGCHVTRHRRCKKCNLAVKANCNND